jgi:superfamily II DNA/RNA helicase
MSNRSRTRTGKKGQIAPLAIPEVYLSESEEDQLKDTEKTIRKKIKKSTNKKISTISSENEEESDQEKSKIVSKKKQKEKTSESEEEPVSEKPKQKKASNKLPKDNLEYVAVRYRVDNIKSDFFCLNDKPASVNINDIHSGFDKKRV